MIPGVGTLDLLTPSRPTQLDRSRCSRQRFARAGCRLCIEACPREALSWSVSGLEVDAARCGSCLLCVAVCPTGALEATDPNPVALLNALARERRPVLACRGCPQARGHARLACLGLLADAELLLALLLALARPLTLNLAGCPGCPNAGMTGALETAIRQVQGLLGEGPALVNPVRFGAELEFQEAGFSRRELLALFGNKTRQGTVALLERLEREPPRDYRSKGLPQSRSLLLRVLAAHPDRPLASRIAAGFPKLEIGAACTGCSGCVGVCPTGALAAPELLGRPPGFMPEMCTDCGVCRAFCRVAAISPA